MKVLITGGAGFIGTNLVHYLTNKGYEVEILDDLSTGLKTNVSKSIKFHEGTIENFELVRQLLKQNNAVVHLAARGSVPRSIKNPVLTQQVNVMGTLNVLEAAREFGCHVVFSSSSSVYGSNTILPKAEDQVLRPLTPYAASKMSGEALMMAYGASYGLPVTNLRFFNVFGPWQRPDHIYSAVIPKWIWSGITGQKIEVYGDGNQSRDFTSVDTVTHVIHRALNEKIISAEPVNLALGNSITLNFLVEKLKEFFPNLQVEYKPPRSGDVYASQNDSSLLLKKFSGLKVKPFDVSLAETVEWMSSHFDLITGGPGVTD